MPTQSLRIPFHDSLTLAALIDQPTSSGPFPFAIVIHGNTGWKEEEHIEGVARGLSERGMLAIRFDAPGSGQSDGTWEHDYRVSNYIEAVKAVHAYVLAHFPVDQNRLFLAAHSMGNLVQLAAAAQLPGVCAIACLQGTSGEMHGSVPSEWKRTGWKSLQTEIFGTISLPYAYYEDRAQYQAVDLLAKLTCPILFVAGTSDELVPVASVKAQYDAYRGPKEYYEFPGDHEYKYQPNQLADVTQRTVNFLTMHAASSG